MMIRKRPRSGWQAGALRSCIAVACCGLLGMAASAGVTDGDLFGHRLGTRLATTPATMGYWSQGRAIIMVDKPEIPPEFEKLELPTTPKTYTIGNIYASKSLPNNHVSGLYNDPENQLLESRPTWARGLKQHGVFLAVTLTVVAPRVGAWIETGPSSPQSGPRALSRPAWARGLQR
ncbi:hypothetical protein LJR066_004832 [Acidovorax sp. LjRoot66]|uniref:hypothetical protein n=1 Tax=Acidovorax sp. LjRoot66 TaxID=3342334 RepID=UPI003ECED1F3